MRPRFSIDELCVYANLLARSAHAPFQQVAYAEFAADLPRVDGFSLVGERRVAGDHEHVRNPRQIGGQILGDPVREILLLRIVAEIGEGQHHDRQTRSSQGLRD